MAESKEKPAPKPPAPPPNKDCNLGGERPTIRTTNDQSEPESGKGHTNE